MRKPLVSVVMSVRNCEKFIKRSIESIFDQAFKDYEIIIYNDVSTDGTWDIVQNIFKASDTKHILINRVVGNNVFCGEGRNKCIEISNGEFIAVQDGDDVSFPERLEEEVEFLEENKDVFCVGSWANVIDEKGKYVETYDYPVPSSDKIKREILIKRNNPIIDPSCMFRKAIFNKLGRYENKWKLVPDFNLWTKAALNHYDMANLEKVLVFYRKHPDSVTNKREMEVVREHYQMCREVLGIRK
jgi:glycosyltransferase involved in cell wall biosynthesis